MARVNVLQWGSQPAHADPLLSWPIYGELGLSYSTDAGTSPDDYEPDIRPQLRLKREDDEILLILSAIIKEL